MSFGQSDTSSKSSSEQQHTMHPTTERIQGMRADELQRLIGATGGFGALSKPRLDLVMPSANEQHLLNRLGGLPGQPLMRDTERDALTTLRTNADPTQVNQAVARSRDYLNQIAAPAIGNEMTAAGMGRSGAMAEALARAGTELALPVSLDANRRVFEGGNELARMSMLLGSTLEGREANRLQTGLNALSVPRQAQYEEMITRPSSLLMSMITGLPILANPVASQGQQRGSMSTTEWGIDLGQIIGAAAGAMMPMCWVAEALYGKHSRETAMARYWITVGWQGPYAKLGRALYRAIGRPVAALTRRSPLVRRLLKPLFDRAVRAGEGALAAVAA